MNLTKIGQFAGSAWRSACRVENLPMRALAVVVVAWWVALAAIALSPLLALGWILRHTEDDNQRIYHCTQCQRDLYRMDSHRTMGKRRGALLSDQDSYHPLDDPDGGWLYPRSR
jgi:hypothetical protein